MKNHEKIITAIVLLLAFDLWGVHAKLLYQLNPDKIGDVVQVFSFVAMNENTITSMLFALVFAFVPVMILTTISPKVEQYWLFVMVFAFFDGGAWFIYYNKTAILHFNSFGAGYYGLFIVFIVASIGFIRMRLEEFEEIISVNNSSNKGIEDLIFEHKTAPQPPPTPGKVIFDVPVETVLRDNDELEFIKFQNRVIDKIETEKKVDKSETDQEILINLLNAGWSQKKIAETLGWNPSKVTRTKQKLITNGIYQPN